MRISDWSSDVCSSDLLSRHLRAHGHTVLEVTRPNRQLRYRHGKNDSLDAECAARSVLSGQATSEPKTQDGSVKMIRNLKLVRCSAVKSKSKDMTHMKTLINNAHTTLRDTLEQHKGQR